MKNLCVDKFLIFFNIKVKKNRFQVFTFDPISETINKLPQALKEAEYNLSCKSFEKKKPKEKISFLK